MCMYIYIYQAHSASFITLIYKNEVLNETSNSTICTNEGNRHKEDKSSLSSSSPVSYQTT